jgi:hypothetical protein
VSPFSGFMLKIGWEMTSANVYVRQTGGLREALVL